MKLLVLTVALLISVKAHAQWEIQDGLTTSDLHAIYSVGHGSGIAWAAGAHGTVLRTEDSGFMWQGCAIPGAESLDFVRITAQNENTATVTSGGANPQRYVTTDACSSWKKVEHWVEPHIRFALPPAPQGYGTAEAFYADAKVWIAVGPAGTTASSDGGKTWHALKPGPIDAKDADKGWLALSPPFAAGEHGRVGKLRADALTTK